MVSGIKENFKKASSTMAFTENVEFGRKEKQSQHFHIALQISAA
jgi:hypothetical protein